MEKGKPNGERGLVLLENVICHGGQGGPRRKVTFSRDLKEMRGRAKRAYGEGTACGKATLQETKAAVAGTGRRPRETGPCKDSASTLGPLQGDSQFRKVLLTAG